MVVVVKLGCNENTHIRTMTGGFKVECVADGLLYSWLNVCHWWQREDFYFRLCTYVRHYRLTDLFRATRECKNRCA